MRIRTPSTARVLPPLLAEVAAGEALARVDEAAGIGADAVALTDDGAGATETSDE
jgi:hypothetical protein